MAGTNHKLCKYCNRMVDANKEHKCRPMLQYLSKQKEQYAKKVKKIDKPLHTKRWRLLRKHIIQLDHGCCQRCLLKYDIYTYTNLEIHHILPRIKHPELMFDENNLITLCHSCNAQLGLSGLDFNWTPTNRKINSMFLI